jgi:hypothetical protein
VRLRREKSKTFDHAAFGRKIRHSPLIERAEAFLVRSCRRSRPLRISKVLACACERVELPDDGDEAEVVIFCPVCALREFGPPKNHDRMVASKDTKPVLPDRVQDVRLANHNGVRQGWQSEALQLSDLFTAEPPNASDDEILVRAATGQLTGDLEVHYWTDADELEQKLFARLEQFIAPAPGEKEYAAFNRSLQAGDDTPAPDRWQVLSPVRDGGIWDGAAQPANSAPLPRRSSADARRETDRRPADRLARQGHAEAEPTPGRQQRKRDLRRKW